MKLLRVIILLSSILVFSGIAKGGELSETEGNFANMPNPTFLGEEEMYSLTTFVWRYTQFLRFRLKKEEKKLHKSAVFFMLGNVKNGEIVSWYSKKRLVNGKVRVIHSYPTGQGLCRTYQAYIKVNGTERHMTNNACKKNWNITWAFYK